MDKKTKVYALIGKIVVGIIVVCLFVPWLIPSLGHAVFKGPVGTIYIADDEKGDHYIAQFKSPTLLCVYHYMDETEELPTIAGVKTELLCEGSLYNPLIGPIHTNPNPGILLWKNYVIFEKDEKQRASVKVTAKNNYLAYAQEESVYTGSYYDEISMGDNYIILSGARFEVPEGRDAEWAQKVIDWFDTYAIKVEEKK